VQRETLGEREMLGLGELVGVRVEVRHEVAVLEGQPLVLGQKVEEEEADLQRVGDTEWDGERV